MIAELIAQLGRFEEELHRGKSVKVNTSATKSRAVDVGSFYFRECRPSVATQIGESDWLRQYDKDWQQLIRLAHGNNSRSSYKTLVRKLRKGAAELNVQALARPATGTVTQVQFSAAEVLLIRTLEGYVPSAAASYQQGVLDLMATPTRLSYRGTATDFREALRETLDHLAPDADVMAETGFKLEEKRTGPTMRQKVRFILISRDVSKTRRTATERSADLIESLSGEIARAVYDRASLSTHAQTTRSEVLQIKRYVDTILFDLLEISDR